MYSPRILVVDDLDSKREYLESLTRSSCPEAEVVTATCTREAQRIIRLMGPNNFTGGVIDFDLGDGDGGEVIEDLRNANPLACITLATARRDESFEEEAAPIAMASGADEALSTCQEDFESRMHGVLTMAA